MNTMMKINENIINYDSQGWPIYKMNLREILNELGAELKDGVWRIADSEKLDVYPMLVEDDGMGYGVNEQYITEINYQPEIQDKFCTIFRESKLNKIDLWNEARFYPNANVKFKNILKNGICEDLKENEWISSFVRDINKTDEGLVYTVEQRKYRDTADGIMTIYQKEYTCKEEDLDWD